MKTSWLAALLMLLSAVLPAADFPPPPDAEVSSVAASTSSLGLQLNIRKFTSGRSMEQTLEFYRAFWQDEAAETEMPPWRMIGSRQGDEYFNVQVQSKADGGSWGYLSISDLPKKLDEKTYRMPTGQGFPMMSGSRVMDDQHSKDPGKDGRTLVIENRFSAQSNRNFYVNHYQNQGWEIVMDQQVAPRNKGYALFVRKGPKTVGLTIAHEDGKTAIVANEVKRGLLR
ncbi:MAG: hypothetical protein PVG66_04555 [Chromatiales bacterium]